MHAQFLNEFSQVVERIYASATNPAAWPETVRAMATLQRSPKATLLTATTAPQNGGFIFPHGLSETALQLWGTKYINDDIWVRKALEKNLLRQGNVMLTPDLLTFESVFR